jgi:hypothetical protein
MSGPDRELTPIVELDVAEAHRLVTEVLGQADIPPLEAIENEDFGRDLLLTRLYERSDEELAALGLRRDEVDEGEA